MAALVRHLATSYDLQLSVIAADAIVLTVTLFAATYAAGVFLMLLTLLAIRHDAFGALAHPGYKHFVRMRVRRDGSAIDAWVLGKVDPLRKDEPVVLVDRFTWHNPLNVDSQTRPSVASSPPSNAAG